MANFKFVSHQAFPEDPYTREIVYLCLEDKYRVAFVRKQAKNGGLFWGVMSTAISIDGSKVYFDSFMVDSNFLEKDIKNFLEQRSWESNQKANNKPSDEDCPF